MCSAARSSGSVSSLFGHEPYECGAEFPFARPLAVVRVFLVVARAFRGVVRLERTQPFPRGRDVGQRFVSLDG